jgi:hypothetical protein
VSIPTALVRMAGASSTRGWVPVSGRRDPGDVSDRSIAAFESVPVSAPAAAFPAASRAAAARVGRAPDSSRRAGHTLLFQFA